MALQNIEANITLDLYNHDTTPTTIKAIQLDSETRYVAARLQNMGAQYDVDSGATVQLTVIRPDKVGVQISGTTFTYGDEGAQFLGPYAELTLVALAVSGKLLGQFKLTSGDQILRTEIFTISAGVALDASTDEWAGEYDGYNLDELVQTVNESNARVDAMEDDVTELKSGFNELTTATAEDVGRALKAKTVVDGKVTEWEFGMVGSPTDSALSPTSENPVQNKTLYNELNILTSSAEDITYVNGDGSTPNLKTGCIAEIAFPTSDPVTVKEVDVWAKTGTSVMLALWSFRRHTQDPSSANYNRGYFTLVQILDEVTAVDNHAVFTLNDLSYDPTSLERVLIASCATQAMGIITNVQNDLMPLVDSNNRDLNSTEVGTENPFLFRFRDPSITYTTQTVYSVTYSQGGTVTATPVKTVVETLNDDVTAIQTATTEDVGKALKAKTVNNGKVTEWEFGDAGSQIEVDDELSDVSENPVQNKVLYNQLIDKNTYTVNNAETTYLSAGKHNVDGMNQYYCGSCDAPTYGTYSVSRIELRVGTNGETIVFGLWQFRDIQTYPTYKCGYWSLVSVLGSVVSADYKAVFEPSTPVVVNGANQRIIATCTNKVISYRRSNFTPNPYKKARVATALARYQNNDFSNIAVGEESTLLTNFYNYSGWKYEENDPNVVAYEITYTPTVPETITEQKTAMEKIEDASVSGVLDGKIWYCAGDSVTAGIDDVLSYAEVIATRNNMTLWKDGIGGSTMTDAGDSKKMNAFSFQRYLNIPANAAFVTIWFGINDNAMHYTVGAIDSDDDSTFYGAYNKVLTWIINNRPLARVGLVVTHKTSTEIETAIRNLAKKYGFLVFDIPGSPDIPFWHPVSSYYASDVSADIKTLRQTQWWREDGNPSHPTADGYKAISYALEKWIMGL